ncbi:MAG TPA: EAL domain-containing protein [Acholeplasmataceae bacterium]|nr:EAL domain-containing protein [Acholeplasmataceae bacterium]HRX44433.1 EAL domain-containing protein [Acholeplasmataceae bacterium]
MGKYQNKWWARSLYEDIAQLKKRPFMMLLIMIALPAIYFTVYYTGGIKYVYSHSMYIPIILAGIYYGPTFGALIGMCAAFLLGPIMPLETSTMEMQEPINWIYRMIIFDLVGIIIGYASAKLRRDAKHIKDLMSVNQETGIPNVNRIKDVANCYGDRALSIYTILISNHHNIIDLLGTDIYHLLIFDIYKDLKEQLPKDVLVIQSDSNKLWIVLPEIDTEFYAKKIVSILNKPYTIKDIPLYADFSIGGSLFYHMGDNCDLTSFEDSDISARHAQLNNLTYVIGDKDKQKKRSEYDLLARFNKALNSSETYLVYQPKIDLDTMKPYGFESLMRWRHPEKGLIPPDVFISLVEETKLIHQLTDWVLIETLKKIKEMMALGHEYPFSINISGKNLYDPQFFERTMKIIEDSKVPSHLIEFELTESTLMINPEESKKTLKRFVDFGIKISLDDFGSGYSSLAYLAQFPIHYIKIDRFFIQNIMKDQAMSEIVKSTIALSKTLGYKVVVEGVESKDVVELLKEYTCEYAQGYYFAKPMLSSDISDWLKKY